MIDNFNNLPIIIQKKILKFCIINTSIIYDMTTPKSYFSNDFEIEDGLNLEFKTNDCYNNTFYILSLSLVCKYWAQNVIPNVELPFTINNKNEYQWFLKWYQIGILEKSKKWYQIKKKKSKYPPIKFDWNQVYLNFLLPQELNIPKEIQNVSLNYLLSQSIQMSSSTNNLNSINNVLNISGGGGNLMNGSVGGGNIQQLYLSNYNDSNSDSGSNNGLEFDYNYNALNLITCSNNPSITTSTINCSSTASPNQGITLNHSGSLLTPLPGAMIHSISTGNIVGSSGSVSPSLSPKLSHHHKHNNPSSSNIYGSLQNHSNIQRLKVKVTSINAKHTDSLMDMMNKNTKMKYLEIDRSELSGYNTIGDIRNFDIALFETISQFSWKLQELKITMTLSGTPIHHLATLTNIKKLYVEFLPSGEGRCDWANFESLLKNAPEIETLSIKDCNRVPFNHIFTVMQNNRSLTELDISECISSLSTLTSSSANLLNLLNNNQLINNPKDNGLGHHPKDHHSHNHHFNNSNSNSQSSTQPTINRVLVSHIDEFPYLTLKEFLTKNNYIQSLSLRFTGIASPLLLNSNSTEFQLSSSSLQKLKLFKLNDKDKLNISFNMPLLKELVLLPYRNRGLLRFLKNSKKIQRLTLYKQDSKPTKSCFEMDELFKTIKFNPNLQSLYNNFYLPQTNAIDFIKLNHPSITNFIHCYENIKHMENDLIESICINNKLESLTLMFNSSTLNTSGLEEGEIQSDLCIIMIILKLVTSVLSRNHTLKSLKVIDISKDLSENLNSCSTGFGCPHFGFCKIQNQQLSHLFNNTQILQFQFPFYMKKYLEKFLIHKKLYSFIYKDSNELISF